MTDTTHHPSTSEEVSTSLIETCRLSNGDLLVVAPTSLTLFAGSNKQHYEGVITIIKSERASNIDATDAAAIKTLLEDVLGIGIVEDTVVVPADKRESFLAFIKAYMYCAASGKPVLTDRLCCIPARLRNHGGLSDTLLFRTAGSDLIMEIIGNGSVLDELVKRYLEQMKLKSLEETA